MALTPQRPGARRPSAGGPPSQAGKQQRKGPSIEELMALPEVVEDGENLSMDPSDVRDAGFGEGDGHTATIVAARFGRFVYKTKDGTIAVGDNGSPIPPEIDLFVTFERAGFDTPRVERMTYVNRVDQFGISADANHVRPRKSYVDSHDGYVPKPYKFAGATMFLKSVVDAGLSLDKLQKEGAAALVGLVVHVRKQKVPGQGANAKAPLLVDYIEGSSSVGGGGTGTASAAKTAGTKRTATSSAPAKETAAAKTVTAAATADGPSVNEISALAEEALLDILTAAEGNTIVRAQIPTTLIQSAKWSKHENRGGILKLLRTDEFINREDAPWTFDGSSITLS